jgi:hypothetical protein
MTARPAAFRARCWSCRLDKRLVPHWPAEPTGLRVSQSADPPKPVQQRINRPQTAVDTWAGEAEEVRLPHDPLAGLRSPRSPCPGLEAVFAFRRRSCDSDLPWSSLSLIRPISSRRMYRLSPRGAISSRLPIFRFMVPSTPKQGRPGRRRNQGAHLAATCGLATSPQTEIVPPRSCTTNATL